MKMKAHNPALVLCIFGGPTLNTFTVKNLPSWADAIADPKKVVLPAGIPRPSLCPNAIITIGRPKNTAKTKAIADSRTDLPATPRKFSIRLFMGRSQKPNATPQNSAVIVDGESLIVAFTQ